LHISFFINIVRNVDQPLYDYQTIVISDLMTFKKYFYQIRLIIGLYKFKAHDLRIKQTIKSQTFDY